MATPPRWLGGLAVAWCVWPALAAAGVIHGIVIEHASSRPLARARVKLEALSGERLEQVSAALANRSGQFTFLSLPDGYYIVSAVRSGYAVTTYGQKRPDAPGALIAVSRDSVTFAELRLSKLAAITGKIFDENRVGLPGLTVLAYPATLPLRSAGSAKSDDRGVYRIAGLARGRYYIRTAAHELEDGLGLLPTFFPESPVAKEARVLRVEVDGEAAEIDVQPLPGKLSKLSGRVTGCTTPVTVTLSSDTGRRQTTIPCLADYTFDGLSPGDYELLAEPAGTQGAVLGPNSLAAHRELFLDRDQQEVNLQLVCTPRVFVQLEERGTTRLRLSDAPLIARRKDLAGEGETTRLSADTAHLLPGYWELTALPRSSHYLESISLVYDRKRASKAGRNEDWHEVYIGASDFVSIRVVLAPRPAKLSGRVTAAGSSPVPGAPVYLYPATPEVRRRVNGLKTTRADANGLYRFDGLAPGGYLVLSSFDLEEVTEESLNAARARTVSLDEGREATQDLVLYQAP